MAADYINFNDITFSYANEPAPIINQCSFTVKEGDRMVLRGESGAGKTTIFRLLLGFETPDAGNIFYKGEHLDDETVREIRSQSAWLPQDLDLGSDRVESLVDLPFQFEKNEAKKPGKDRIIETFKRLGLPASSLEKDFADLSTGQRQRVGLAICHLLDKPLILLDEPTSALDSASKENVVKLLFNHPERTILSTSHDPWWIEKSDSVFEIDI
jgi:ABC-type bacteriocin/lantibiotic exporter with double-glycine peptidase domain